MEPTNTIEPASSIPGTGDSTLPTLDSTSSDASLSLTYGSSGAVGNVLASNRLVALQKNQEFPKLTANSPCDAADPLQINACVNGSFMRCTGGAYKTILECTAPARCFALPLETKEGLSVACVNVGDAASKLGIEVSELENVIKGAPIPTAQPTSAPSAPSSSSVASPPGSRAPTIPTTPADSPPTATRVFGAPLPTGLATTNRILALQKNQEFPTLKADMSCDQFNDLQRDACINGAYMTCNMGVYRLAVSCNAPSRCFALPLQDRDGFSVTCVKVDEAASKLGVGVDELEKIITGGPIPTVFQTSSSSSTAVVPTSSAPPAPPVPPFLTMIISSPPSSSTVVPVPSYTAPAPAPPAPEQPAPAPEPSAPAPALPAPEPSAPAPSAPVPAPTTASPEPVISTSSSADYPAPVTPTDTPTKVAGTIPSPSKNASPILSGNRELALKKNKDFARLIPDVPCVESDPTQLNACIKGNFMRCQGGRYKQMVACDSPARCFALPLEMKAGLMVACVSYVDAAQRIGISVKELEDIVGAKNPATPVPMPTFLSSTSETVPITLPTGKPDSRPISPTMAPVPPTDTYAPAPVEPTGTPDARPSAPGTAPAAPTDTYVPAPAPVPTTTSNPVPPFLPTAPAPEVPTSSNPVAGNPAPMPTRSFEQAPPPIPKVSKTSSIQTTEASTSIITSTSIVVSTSTVTAPGEVATSMIFVTVTAPPMAAPTAVTSSITITVTPPVQPAETSYITVTAPASASAAPPVPTETSIVYVTSTSTAAPVMETTTSTVVETATTTEKVLETSMVYETETKTTTVTESAPSYTGGVPGAPVVIPIGNLF